MRELMLSAGANDDLLVGGRPAVDQLAVYPIRLLFHLVMSVRGGMPNLLGCQLISTLRLVLYPVLSDIYQNILLEPNSDATREKRRDRLVAHVPSFLISAYPQK